MRDRFERISGAFRGGQMTEGSDRPAARVLVVDDEPSIVSFVSTSLRLCNCAVSAAGNGADALLALSMADRFDLAILDMQLPEMDGVELARMLRQKLPDLKVLYLTGHSDRLFERHSQLWAGEAYLDKPCTFQSLTEAASLAMFGTLHRLQLAL